MAVTNNIQKIGVTRVGKELVTFGTKAATMTAVFPNERPEIEAQQEQLAVMDERARPNAHIAPVQGFKTGSIPLSFNLRAPATQLTDAATPPSDTPALYIPLEMGLGGKNSIAAGAALTSGSDTDTLKLSSGGTNFAAGEWVIGYLAGAPYPCLVKSVSTNDLEIWPALSGSPASGQKVYKTYQYHFDYAGVGSISVDRAVVGDANNQIEALGCCVTGIEVSLENGKLPTYKAAISAGTYNGPTALSLSTAQPTDSDGTHFFVNASATSGLMLLQSTATTTRTNYVIEKASIKLDLGNGFVPGIGGGVEGKVGVMRLDPKRPAGTVSIQVRTDQSWDAIYTAQTPLVLVHATQFGTGSTARWLIVSCTFVLTKPLGIGGVDGERGIYTLEGELVEDTICTGVTQQAVSPFRIAFC